MPPGGAVFARRPRGLRRGQLIAGQGIKEGIALVPRGSFGRESGLGGIGGHVGAADGQRDAELIAQRADERLVSVGLRTAQPMVKVRRLQRDAERFL